MLYIQIDQMSLHTRINIHIMTDVWWETAAVSFRLLLILISRQFPSLGRRLPASTDTRRGRWQSERKKTDSQWSRDYSMNIWKWCASFRWKWLFQFIWWLIRRVPSHSGTLPWLTVHYGMCLVAFRDLYHCGSEHWTFVIELPNSIPWCIQTQRRSISNWTSYMSH